MSKAIDLNKKHNRQTLTIDDEPASKSALYLVDLARILIFYAAWKIFLVAVVAASPTPGYDTSTEIFFNRNGHTPQRGIAQALHNLAIRLSRWDGIYFTSNAHDGYVYEQQWAFSWVMARSINALSRVLLLPQSLSPLITHALAACIISFITHLGAVVALYFLVIAILPSALDRRRTIARTTAYLHIVSPAGVFLLAPYGEATFAFLNITGMLLYAHAIRCRTRNDPVAEAILTSAAGIAFGLATTIRSNGILSGIIFAWDALKPAYDLVFRTRTQAVAGKLATTVSAGCFIAVGFILPQEIAYREYCVGVEVGRPWCNWFLPSIYSWVQEHYWEVGLFKYWTLSNLPLFLIATPVLSLLILTGYAALHHARAVVMAVNGEERPVLMKSTEYQASKLAFRHVMERLALPQLMLAILTASSFHVQIINRISSGYPVWYLLLAIAIQDQSPLLECGHPRSAHYYPFRWLQGNVPKIIVQGLVVYAVVQAGLYSCFLPPA